MLKESYNDGFSYAEITTDNGALKSLNYVDIYKDLRYYKAENIIYYKIKKIEEIPYFSIEIYKPTANNLEKYQSDSLYSFIFVNIVLCVLSKYLKNKTSDDLTFYLTAYVNSLCVGSIEDKIQWLKNPKDFFKNYGVDLEDGC